MTASLAHEASTPARDAEHSATPVSRLVVVDRGDDASRRAAELAVHLLAQLPPDVTATLPAGLARVPVIDRLTRAYGLGPRIRVECRPEEAHNPGSLVLNDAASQTPGELLASVEPREPATSAFDSEVLDDGLLAGHRVAVVTNIAIHYRAALFELVEQRLQRLGATFRALLLADAPRDRPWIDTTELDFSHERVRCLDVGRRRGRRLLPLGLGRALDRFAPTIVVSGGFSPLVSHRCARWCANRSAFGLWSGEIQSRRTARSRLRARQRRVLVQRADFSIAYGWESLEYLRSLRPDLPIVIGRNSTPLVPSAGETRTGTVELLAVSRAEQGKALDLVVDAVLALRELDCRLTVVGDGPQLSALQAQAGDSPRIRFLGALAHERVLDEYRKADVFVFPSQFDVFGLVLVEAKGAGLAVITSDRPGAVADLAAPGSNCLVVRDPSPAAWADAIRLLVGDPELRRRLGDAAARTIADRWTIAHSADAMIAGVRLGALELASRGGRS
jgi:glycosyltransferase involved in cell wall biosynthesis